MLTLKDMNKKQRGPWIYTLLEGRALERCERLTLADLSSETGEDDLWKLLEDRFPQKEALDLMGESLGEVFGLAAKDGESSKEWCARVKDCFDRCSRRAGVAFPEQARGWITLRCAGLSDEQRAIIKAKTQGDLAYEKIAQAFQSCFPTYKASSRAKKAIGCLMVEEIQDDVLSQDGETYPDVEAFLADRGMTIDPEEPVSESEAAEALAISWKVRRKEIQKVSQPRKFHGGPSSSSASSRSFRIDMEELRRRTRCRRCGKVGHWARERSAENQRKNPKRSQPLRTRVPQAWRSSWELQNGHAALQPRHQDWCHPQVGASSTVGVVERSSAK